MDSFVRQHVDYNQYQVRSVPYWRTGMGIYVVGDDLLHVSSSTECTGFAATHTGWIEMRVVIRDDPPCEISDEWDAISETTLWCPRGVLSVHSMMGSTTEELVDLSVRPGLIRVRAHARNRIHESIRTDDDPPEQHELLVWPVTEELGPWTLRTDGTRGQWEQKRAKAAEYAMLDVIRPYDTHEERDPDLPRVTVVRRSAVPLPVAEAMRLLEGRLPVGDHEVGLARTAEDTLQWRCPAPTLGRHHRTAVSAHRVDRLRRVRASGRSPVGARPGSLSLPAWASRRPARRRPQTDVCPRGRRAQIGRRAPGCPHRAGPDDVGSGRGRRLPARPPTHGPDHR